MIAVGDARWARGNGGYSEWGEGGGERETGDDKEVDEVVVEAGVGLALAGAGSMVGEETEKRAFVSGWTRSAPSAQCSSALSAVGAQAAEPQGTGAVN